MRAKRIVRSQVKFFNFTCGHRINKAIAASEKESAYSEELNRMSVYEALTKTRYNKFRYCNGKNYSHSDRHIIIRTNSVIFMPNEVNMQPVIYHLRELRVREWGNMIYIVDRSGKTIITICKSS